MWRVGCEDEECDMFSYYEFFEDGSHRCILMGCQHRKRFPSRQEILKWIEEER